MISHNRVLSFLISCSNSTLYLNRLECHNVNLIRVWEIKLVKKLTEFWFQLDINSMELINMSWTIDNSKNDRIESTSFRIFSKQLFSTNVWMEWVKNFILPISYKISSAFVFYTVFYNFRSEAIRPIPIIRCKYFTSTQCVSYIKSCF